MKNLNFKFAQRTGFRSARSRPIFETSRVCRKAAVLHLDIVGSTSLVRRDLIFAHHQIQQLYRRISEICLRNFGIARELRGDAVVAEFNNAEDALNAAIRIQNMGRLLSGNRLGRLNPPMRIGISFGEIVSDGHISTGLPIIRAQRLEQLAESDQVIVDEHLLRQLNQGAKNQLEFAGTEKFKGFDETIDIFSVIVSELNRSPNHLPGTFLQTDASCGHE